MINLKNMSAKISCFLTIIIAISSSIYADEVTDYINEGLNFYKKGQYSDSTMSLNQAMEIIQQIKGKSLRDLLPAPLSGWKANETTADTSTVVFGGGIEVERLYHKNDSSVSINIIADSVMLQSVMMLLTNPMFAQSDGAKLKRIANQRALIEYDSTEKRGEIQIVVANRFLVKISGNGVENQDLINYTKKIDYDKIAKIN